MTAHPKRKAVAPSGLTRRQRALIAKGVHLPPDPGVYPKVSHDVRLYGTWQSDRERTMAEWVWPADVTPERKRKTEALFGKLRIRYCRDVIHTELNAFRETTKYEVIGADSDSVACLAWASYMAERRISHIHFEGRNAYWLAIGHQREWFKRVPASKQSRNSHARAASFKAP